MMDSLESFPSDGDATTVDASRHQATRRALFAGQLSARELPATPPTCVKLYVSAPYTDFKEEMYVLETDVVPKLKDYCRVSHGCEFDAVYMGAAHCQVNGGRTRHTSALSTLEIDDCKYISVGPFFLALVGNRYGLAYGPPQRLTESEYEHCCQTLEALGYSTDLLEASYALDENDILSQEYRLCCTKTGSHEWLQTEKKLLNLLRIAGFNPAAAATSAQETSDLHREIDAGILSVLREKARNDGCLCFMRTIDNLSEHLSSRASPQFVDLHPGTHDLDRRQADSLHALRDDVLAKLTGSGCVLAERVSWAEPNGVNSGVHTDYLRRFGRNVFEQVRRHVDVCSAELQGYPHDDMFVEVLQHWRAAWDLSDDHRFSAGHEELLLATKQYVGIMSDHVLVLHGPPGIGKSTIAAKTACEIVVGDAHAGNLRVGTLLTTKVIVKFIGLTPNSTDLLSLLLNLISQIEEAIDLPEEQYDKSSLSAVTDAFVQLISKGAFNCRLLLILDGIENIAYSRASTSVLDWLPVTLPTNVKLILTVRDDDECDIFRQLQHRKGSSAIYLPVQSLAPETCLHIADQRLRAASRQLTKQQWHCVSTAFHACCTPLFTEVVFNEVREWTSASVPHLQSSVDDTIQMFLHCLETRHGTEFISHALCYVTVARHGLTEAELQDVLSLDDAVLCTLFDKYEPPVRRLPRSAWVALKHDLAPYWRRVRCRSRTLLCWKNKQFAACIRRRYKFERSSLSIHVHDCLADYFLGTWQGVINKPYVRSSYLMAKSMPSAPSQDASDDVTTTISASAPRFVASQPTIHSGHGVLQRYNDRKLVELPFHLYASGRHRELAELVLFNFDWLLAKIDALGHAYVLNDYAIVMAESSGETVSSNEDHASRYRAAAKLVADALAAAGPCHPHSLSTELAGRLLPAATGQSLGLPPRQLRWLQRLIRQCDLHAARLALSAPVSQLYVSPAAVLEHSYAVHGTRKSCNTNSSNRAGVQGASLCLSADLDLFLVERPDGQYACTKSRMDDLVMSRDVARSHDDKATLTRRYSGVNGVLYVTPDGTRALSRADMIISLWDTRTACLLTTFDCYQHDSSKKAAQDLTECKSHYYSRPTACAATGNDYFCFAVSRTAGPYVLDLHNAAVLHRFGHQCTSVALDDGVGSSNTLACNDGRNIYCYGLPLVERRYMLALDDLVMKILFTMRGSKLCALVQGGSLQSIVLPPKGAAPCGDVTRRRAAGTIQLWHDAAIDEILVSHATNHVLARTAKCLTLCDAQTSLESWNVKCRDVALRHSASGVGVGSSDVAGSQLRFTDARFSCDDVYIVAACHYYVAICSATDGAIERILEAPLPVPIKTLRTFHLINKFATLLDSGSVQLWNLDYCLRPARYKPSYFPGPLTSLAVNTNGKVLACCSPVAPYARVVTVDATSSITAVTELRDPFACGTQPIAIEVSPCGRYAVTRCSNEADGSIMWSALYCDYVWDVSLGRVTHFFDNSLCVLFGGFTNDDESTLLVDVSCLNFHSGDPSNKQFMTLSYRLATRSTTGEGRSNDVTLSDDRQHVGNAGGLEQRSILPDGDVVGQPLLLRQGTLVCLLQPCIKTRLRNVLVEQRLADIQLLLLDLFTSAAADRQLVRCRDLIPDVGDCYFIDMQPVPADAVETGSTPSADTVVLFFVRGRALPPYHSDGRLNRDVPMRKGMLVYDIGRRLVVRRVDDFPRCETGMDSMLLSRSTRIIVDGQLTVQEYTAQRGHVTTDLSSSQLAFCIGSSNDDRNGSVAVIAGRIALALDGSYIIAITKQETEIVVVDAHDGVIRSRCAVHGQATVLKVGADDRTLYVGCSDGRIMCLKLLPHTSDPMRMLISQLPSRQV